MNHIRILFFATLRDRAGVRSVDLEIPAQLTVAGLKRELVERYPPLREIMAHTIVAMNREYALETALVPGEAEVALFPPVSGG